MVGGPRLKKAAKFRCFGMAPTHVPSHHAKICRTISNGYIGTLLPSIMLGAISSSVDLAPI